MKMNESRKIVIYFAHPASHKSRINAAMLKAVEGLDNVSIRRLYDLYPDYYIDIRLEQSILVDHDVIVWQHPFYWYSAPSLLKEWIDLVLEHGFAYGHEGKALAGKFIMTAITTGGRKDAYHEQGRNHFTIRQLLAPFEQTSNLCNMKYLPPFVVHGTLAMEATQINNAAEEYRKAIIAIRDRHFTDDEMLSQEYINNMLEFE